MPPILALLMFLVGAGLTIWATEELIKGLVGLSTALKVSAFVAGVVLSGFEAENIAVGITASLNGSSQLALGTIYGGAIFLVCVALGLGALLFPLEVNLPKGFIILFALSPVISGLALIEPVTPRWVGVVLLLVFVGAIVYLIIASRGHTFLLSKEVEEGATEKSSLAKAIFLTIGGIALIVLGGELVTQGAENIISGFGIPAGIMGMIITPAAIELEEIIRQAVPSKSGRHDISAGNLIGTLLYFLIFNNGIIALVAPVKIDPQVIRLDFPFLVIVTFIAAIFLWRGKVGRGAGLFLLASYVVYVGLHFVFN